MPHSEPTVLSLLPGRLTKKMLAASFQKEG